MQALGFADYPRVSATHVPSASQPGGNCCCQPAIIAAHLFPEAHCTASASGGQAMFCIWIALTGKQLSVLCCNHPRYCLALITSPLCQLAGCTPHTSPRTVTCVFISLYAFFSLALLGAANPNGPLLLTGRPRASRPGGRHLRTAIARAAVVAPILPL